MHHSDIAIATITLARDAQERNLLHQSMKRLSELGMPTIVADGGSGVDFTDYLETLPNLKVYRLNKPGLFSQAKQSLTAACDLGTKYILYTEADKLSFFDKRLDVFISQATENTHTGIVLASRDSESFLTFPKFQRHTEAVMNQLAENFLGQKADYCYGPMLIQGALINYLNLVQENIGWGHRFFLMGIAYRLGQHIDSLTLTLPNSSETQQEETRDVQLYRTHQLFQNLQGLVLGFKVSIL